MRAFLIVSVVAVVSAAMFGCSSGPPGDAEGDTEAAGSQALECAVFGDQCTFDDDCCSGECSFPGHKCLGSPDMCAPFGQFCENSRECCNGGACRNSKCGSPGGGSSCSEFGDQCTFDDDCCSGECSFPGHKCVGSSTACAPFGQFCESSSQCCDGGGCRDGKCGSPGGGSSCSEFGAQCTFDDDCCSGECSFPGHKCVGSSTACAPFGQYCETSSECCNGAQCQNQRCGGGHTPPPAPPTPPPPPQPQHDGCYSASLGRDMPEGACVQSHSNQTWYQCHLAQWIRGVTGSTGPYGACVGVYPAP